MINFLSHLHDTSFVQQCPKSLTEQLQIMHFITDTVTITVFNSNNDYWHITAADPFFLSGFGI